MLTMFFISSQLIFLYCFTVDKVLGLDPNSRSVISTDEIKKSYKKISLNLHPDKLAQRGNYNSHNNILY